ncbi:MAG TPA: type II toxin-antitoxin system HicB family antitoxin [Ktedonobacterales bacterium]|nr:type II toxin-antitoxin system HicB family antitoxin [Ktedonobacterales bacterium]
MTKSKKSKTLKYSMTIQWSDEDGCYVVLLPEWEGLVLQPVTDGKTPRKAAKHGRQVLEMMIDIYQRDGKPLPPPKTYVGLDDDATI